MAAARTHAHARTRAHAPLQRQPRPQQRRALARADGGDGDTRANAPATRRGALLAGAAAGLLPAGARRARALSFEDDGRGYVVCGPAPEGDLGPQNFTATSRDNANKLFLRWLVKEIDAEMAGADWRDALRLSLMDASTGAVDGSIRFELDRPYAAGLEDIVKRYDAAKAAIDPKLSVPVGYGDLYALGAKVLMNRAWREDYAGLTERFEARSTYKRGAFAEAGGDVDADEGFKGAFLKLYSPVDLGPDGTPIQLGRADAEGPSPEEAAALVPVGNAALESDAAAYREWFAALGVKFLALAPLAPYLDTTGAAAAAFKADGGFGGLAGFVERNERDVAQPGLVERRVVYAYSDVMTIGSGLLGQGDSLNKFNQDKYAIPAYVDGVGWTTVPPMKGVDYAKLYKGVAEGKELVCKPAA